jgi:hypothetical protein
LVLVSAIAGTSAVVAFCAWLISFQAGLFTVGAFARLSAAMTGNSILIVTR